MSSPAEARPRAREGLQLRTRWFGSEFIPFDEMLQLDDVGVRLRSGSSHRLPTRLRPAAIQALSPPDATGQLTRDATQLAHYIEGSWSPVRAAQALLAMATATQASDVHIEAEAEGYQIRLRQAGTMIPFTTLAPASGLRLVAALKHLAGCLPYRSDVVQEGRIPREGIAADVRASFMPTALGERVALRLFGRLRTLAELGLPDPLRQRFETLLHARSGLVLVVGPSGAGKTTTIYAALAFLAAHRDGAHLSIEDPVEQRLRIAGIQVDQVELLPERGLSADVALVGALRQDVDVVALGEVRRPAEAQLALEAAHTGRLVLVGLHAGSAAEAHQRMRDLGADPGVLDATLRGILVQRLETVPCPETTPDCPDCGGIGQLRRPTADLWLAGEHL